MEEPRAFVRQTAFTSVGLRGARVELLEPTVAVLRVVPQQVSLHFRRAESAGMDVAGRRDEARLRLVSRMLERIGELDPRPLSEPRSEPDKLIGHCRTSAVLLTSLLRAHGFAARPRAGFSAYWRQRMRTGHWVTEYWSPDDASWLFADGDLDDEWARQGDLGFDLCNVPRAKFVLSGHAWAALRAGEAEALDFGEDRNCCGLEYARAQLLRDVACLTGCEVGAWDRWGVALPPFEELDEASLALLDELARVSTVPHPRDALEALLASHEGAAVPTAIAEDGAAADRYLVDVPDIWRDAAGPSPR